MPEFSLPRKEHWFCSWPRGTAMGELFLLISCGAAFITGLVIAAASLLS
jgi:hypothetical protein